MTREEILAGNKLIAEFQGWKFEWKDQWHGSFEGSDRWLITQKEFEILLERGFDFHKSWDKLMSVVEKIEKENYGIKICRRKVEVYIDSTKETIIEAKEKCKMDSLYVGIIKFLNWHNINKNNKA